MSSLQAIFDTSTGTIRVDLFPEQAPVLVSKIMENEKAVQAMAEQANAPSAMPAHHAPDLSEEDVTGG